MRKHRRTAAALLAAALGLGMASALPGAASAVTTVDSEDLLLHYDFETAGVVTDMSGNGNDGILRGTGAVVAGGVLTLPGGSSGSNAGYVEIPRGTFDGQDTLTISTWLRNETGNGNYSALFFGSAANPPSQYYLLNPRNTAGRFKSVVTGAPNASAPWGTEYGISPTTAAQGVPGPLTGAAWAMYTTVIQPGSITGYYNGELIGTVPITRTVSQFGSDLVSYIGRSSYSDIFYRGEVDDLVVATRALTAQEVAAEYAAAGDAYVDADAAAFTIGDTSAVTADLTLPTTTPGGSSVTWQTSDAGVVTASGVVTRPAAGSAPATATLTATLSQRGATAQKQFTVTVLPLQDDASRAEAAAAALVVHDVDDVRGNLFLPSTGPDGSSVTWTTSDADVISATGEVTRPAHGEPAVEVALTATVTIGAATATRVLDAHVPALPAPADYEGYLFSHFLGEGLQHGEQVYFALSEGNNPLRYTNLNGGQPIMVSTSGEMGLRDPYIIRSPEGDKFYQIATDLRMWNQSSGSWDYVQRQGSRNIVVWESTDLVNWSESWVAEVAPENAGNAWAPEIFYDDARGEYVVFWASKLYAENDPNHTGGAYNQMLFATTRDFRNFSEPEPLIDYGYSVIDTTMIEHDGEVYRFSKNEENQGTTHPAGKHVFQEVGSGPTADDFELVRAGVGAGSINQGEGPTVFKSNTEERWYLFIDEYGGRGYVPFTTTDLASGEWTMLATNQYSFPSRFRHGTVLPVTGAEWSALQIAYGTADASAVERDLTALSIPDADDVRGDVSLPTQGANGTAFSWSSSAPGVVSPTGTVTRPAHGQAPAQVTLTVTATKGSVVRTRTFTLTVQPLEPSGPEVSVEADTRCVAGKIVQTVRVTNDSGASVDVAVSSDHGSRSVTVGADRATSLAFSTRAASVPAGQVSVTASADGASRTVVAPYAARSCA